MHRFLFVTLVFLFCLSKAFGAALPVLVYHHIQEKVTSDVSCTPEDFEAQIKAMKDAGFTALSLAETAEFLSGGLKDIEKPVLITFDDGYESLYEYAYPTAKKHEVKMTIFVITARLGKKPQFTKYLSREQIKEMHDSGYFEFGSHTHDLHTDTIRIFEAFKISDSSNPVIDLVKKDLKKSAETIRTIIGSAPVALAWPYGKFNAHFTEAAVENGFKIHFTSIPGTNKADSGLFGVKRIPVTARDTVFSVLKKLGHR
ncbi:MAG: polysaccharide deacetylase family protein [Candidatus Riflebacteria bacterium]|nr:polysaccharide deacetylase family protein [Candidatus Riflebacteria bacterium]